MQPFLTFRQGRDGEGNSTYYNAYRGERVPPKWPTTGLRAGYGKLTGSVPRRDFLFGWLLAGFGDDLL
jgi:hypothetical protein